MNTHLQHLELRYLLPFLALAGFILASGCSDIVSVDPADRDHVVEEPSKKTERVNGRDVAAWSTEIQARSKKARHHHVLDRGILPVPAGKVTAGQDSGRLPVGVQESSVADSVLQIVLDYHKIFNRF